MGCHFEAFEEEFKRELKLFLENQQVEYKLEKWTVDIKVESKPLSQDEFEGLKCINRDLYSCEDSVLYSVSVNVQLLDGKEERIQIANIPVLFKDRQEEPKIYFYTRLLVDPDLEGLPYSWGNESQRAEHFKWIHIRIFEQLAAIGSSKVTVKSPGNINSKL